MSGKLNLGTRLQNIPTPEDSYNGLFGVSGSVNRIQELRISDLHPYPDQPFRPYSECKLKELAADIKENGLQSPIIVRKMQADTVCAYSYYQILAGHNRANACKLLNMETVPAIVREVDDVAAQLIMVNTNLNQRDELLPSEKAFAYRIQMEAKKVKSGERTDLVHNVHKVDTMDEIAVTNEESRRNIAYYIRLTYLVMELLDLVDDGRLPFRAGVALSYLSKDEQLIVDAYLSEKHIKLTVEQAEDIKRYSTQMSPITYAQLDRLFCHSTPASPPPTELKTIKFGKRDVARMADYIPVADKKKAADYVIKALKFYRENGGGA